MCNNGKVFEKSRPPNNVPLFQKFLVPHCFLHKTPTGIGMAWAHLPKPLARENAQPSECYVCTIDDPQKPQDL